MEFVVRVFGLAILVVSYLAAKEVWDWWSERRGN